MPVSPAARLAIEQLAAGHGPLLFVESHGCCDNRAPMCLPAEDFLVGSSDVLIASVAGCPYYVDARTLAFRGPTDDPTALELDVELGYPEGFSLGVGDLHFTLRRGAPR